MSLRVRTDVCCDTDGCDAELIGVVQARSNARSSRKKARRAGWMCIEGAPDLCPACAAAKVARQRAA